MKGNEFPGDAITDVYFLDSQIGWMGLSTGDLLSTINGGKEWCKKLNPAKVWINNTVYDKGHFKRIAFADKENGVALDNDGLFCRRITAFQNTYSPFSKLLTVSSNSPLSRVNLSPVAGPSNPA